MELIIGSIVGLLLAGGFYYGFHRSANRVALIKSTKTTKTKELVETADGVAKEIGPGSFRELVELKGTITSSSPLRSELSNQDCVWYSYTVTREYEETYLATDSEGRQTQQIRRGSEVVSSNVRSQSFLLDDGTGTVAVDPEGAEIQGLKTHSSFQPGEPMTGFRIGSVLLNAVGIKGAGRQTLGYRSEEFTLPLGKEAFILGEASDVSGTLTVKKPEQNQTPFLISLKSEEQLVKDAMGAETGFLIGAIVLTLGSLTALTFGILRMLNL